MIKPPSPTLGRPRNEVRDPDGNPVAFLGSYERKNRKGNSSKTVYYSYWLDENALGKDGKPKKKKHYYKKPYPAVIIEHRQRMDKLKGEIPSTLITGEQKDKFEIIYESWEYDGIEPDGTPKLIKHDDSVMLQTELDIS